VNLPSMSRKSRCTGPNKTVIETTPLRETGICWGTSHGQGTFGWLRGVDLFPSRSLIPRNLLILRWSGMPRKATKASPSFSFHSARAFVFP
jgi:hypothetical protein